MSPVKILPKTITLIGPKNKKNICLEIDLLRIVGNNYFYHLSNTTMVEILMSSRHMSHENTGYMSLSFLQMFVVENKKSIEKFMLN